jgi:hypothetical protein
MKRSYRRIIMETAIASYRNNRTGCTLPKDLTFECLPINEKYNFVPVGPEEGECFGYYLTRLAIGGEEKIRRLLSDVNSFFKNISQVNIYPSWNESQQYAKLTIEIIGHGITEEDHFCIIVQGKIGIGQSQEALQQVFLKEIEELMKRIPNE